MQVEGICLWFSSVLCWRAPGYTYTQTFKMPLTKFSDSNLFRSQRLNYPSRFYLSLTPTYSQKTPRYFRFFPITFTHTPCIHTHKKYTEITQIQPQCKQLLILGTKRYDDNTNTKRLHQIYPKSIQRFHCSIWSIESIQWNHFDGQSTNVICTTVTCFSRNTKLLDECGKVGWCATQF